MPRAGPIAPRFWAKVVVGEPSACWEWAASRNVHGYGKFGMPGKHGRHIGAHRASWLINRGPIPPGLFVLHRCDNRPCVNPAHLFLGTNRDNALDMVAKGRARGFRRLDEDAVREIKKRLSTSSYRTLARQFGVSMAAIGYIKRGRTWAHVR